MGNATTEIPHEFKNKIEIMDGSLEKMAHNASAKVNSMATEIKDAANGYVKTGQNYVKANPVKVMAMAAAAGVLTGSILTMALRSRRQQ